MREALCELELPYKRIACGKGSRRRAHLQKAAGSTQVPCCYSPDRTLNLLAAGYDMDTVARLCMTLSHDSLGDVAIAQVPYLVDPNTGEAIQDSEQAVRYLFATYASAVSG